MNTNLCRLLYEGLLKRPAEQGALEYWAMMIKSGWSHEKVLAAFLDSNEFKERNKGSELLFVPPGHFYSPIVDTNTVGSLFDDLSKREITSISLRKEDQVEMWLKFMPHFLK